MAKVEGVNKLVTQLRARAARAREDSNVSVAVGYSAKYAIFVHENLEAKLAGQPRPSGLGVYWGPHGGPKFLEGPAREMRRELGAIVREAVKKGKTLAQGLLLAGLRLQRESQQRVPVEFGILRASAFTRLED